MTRGNIDDVEASCMSRPPGPDGIRKVQSAQASDSGAECTGVKRRCQRESGRGLPEGAVTERASEGRGHGIRESQGGRASSPYSGSQHSRTRSNRKGRSASLRWQCPIIYAAPWTSSTRRGVIMGGCGCCPPCSYTIVMAHRSVIAIVKASKPAGGSIVQIGASANVSGCDTRIKSAMALTVGVGRSIARNTSLTTRASDSARCSAPLAISTLAATFSRL
jgi:hypothetical protein